MNDQALDKIRELVTAQVERSILTPHDERRLDISELLPLYVQLQMLDTLQNIDDTLTIIMSHMPPPEKLRKMAEKAQQEMVVGETEEGGFAIEVDPMLPDDTIRIGDRVLFNIKQDEL